MDGYYTKWHGPLTIDYFLKTPKITTNNKFNLDGFTLNIFTLAYNLCVLVLRECDSAMKKQTA